MLTRDSILDLLSEVTVAPLTSTIREIPSEVPLDKSDGMQRPCAVNCDHFQTVSVKKLGGLLTTLSAARMREVGRAARFALDLDG